jgi:hypothetical protein
MARVRVRGPRVAENVAVFDTAAFEARSGKSIPWVWRSPPLAANWALSGCREVSAGRPPPPPLLGLVKGGVGSAAPVRRAPVPRGAGPERRFPRPVWEIFQRPDPHNLPKVPAARLRGGFCALGAHNPPTFLCGALCGELSPAARGARRLAGPICVRTPRSIAPGGDHRRRNPTGFGAAARWGERRPRLDQGPSARQRPAAGERPADTKGRRRRMTDRDLPRPSESTHRKASGGAR